MRGRMLATILITIGLSLAWKAASAEPRVSNISSPEKATNELTLTINLTGLAPLPSQEIESPTTLAYLYNSEASLLSAFRHEWWIEAAAQNAAPSTERSIAEKAASSVAAVAWREWQRPF